MPGMEMNMGFRMEQRQELRQEMRLEQRLTMEQVQTMGTSGAENAAEQAALLKRFAQEISGQIYKDPADFHFRCMKRVKKEDRTESKIHVVHYLRQALDQTMPRTLGDVQELLDYGIHAFEKRSWVPSMEYEQLAQTLAARQELGVKDYIFTALKKDLAKQERSNFAHLLSTLSENKRLNDDTFMALAVKTEAIPGKVIDRIETEVNDGLPQERITLERCKTALDTIVSFYELMPDFYQDRIARMVRAFAEQEDALAIAARYASIPLPLLAAASTFSPNEEQLGKLDRLCQDEQLARDRDRKRHLYFGAHQLTLSTQGKEIFDHTLALATNAWELEKLYETIGGALRIARGTKDLVQYPHETKTFAELYGKLREQQMAGSFGAIPLSPGYASKLLDRFDNIPTKLLSIISSLSKVYQGNYPEGLPILGRLVEKIVDGDAGEWKYTHEKAASQLLHAADSAAWRENLHRTCILKAGDKIAQKAEVLKTLGIEAAELYQQKYGAAPTRKHVHDLDEQIRTAEELLRQPGSDKKTLGPKASELRTQYALANTVDLLDGKLESIDLSRSFFKEKSNDKRFVLYADVMQRALECLNAPELKSMETITISEADDYVSVLNVGVDPVQSCQRWTEPTGYNKCLLAYVLDANKKVWYVRDKSHNTIARAVERLLPFRKDGFVLLLEQAYSNHWSADHARALVSTALQKAAKISEEKRLPVRVGYTDRRSAEQYEAAFKEFAEKGDVKLRWAKLDMTLPESMNHFEYSDALGGCLASGSKVSGQTMHYLLVGSEEE